MTAVVETAAPYMPVVAKSEDWATPPEILAPVRRAFGGVIDLDPAGNPYSVVGAVRQVWLPKWACNEAPNCEAHPLPGNVVIGDGLKVEWMGNCFFNPAYDAETLAAFMWRAHESAEAGANAIGFVPQKTDQPGWQAAAKGARLVCAVRGRVRHLLPSGAKGDGAPFPQALILWTRDDRLVHRVALELSDIGFLSFPR